jgi:dynein assembly factor 5, axonemal
MELLLKDINGLQSGERGVRKSAFEKVLRTISDPQCALSKDDQFQVLKSVLRGLEDKTERCREIAIQIISELVPRLPADVLDWVLPSVVARIGLEPVAEESEELRLQLLRLAMLCVDTFPHELGPRNFLDYFRVLLENCLKDPFPELKKAACVGCQRLCEVEPKKVKHLAVPLAKMVKNMCLQHKHSNVRAEAVKTFSALLSHGGIEVLGDMKDEQDNRTTVYWMYILCCDNSDTVRSAVVAFLSKMLLDIPERGDQHRRLLPHLLIMLTDEYDSIRVAANSVLLGMGKLYMIDNEDNSVNVEKRRITMKDIDWYGDDAYPDMSLQTKSTLPLPDLSNRPHLGSRYVIAEVARTILDKILIDCLALDWTIPFSKHNKRVVALRCLQMLIYFCETNIVQFAQQILAALYKSIRDDNDSVRIESLVCVELMGKFMTPDQYLPFVISQPSAESQERAGPEADGDLRVERSRTKTVTVVSAGEVGSVHQHLPTLFSTAPHSTRASILIAFKFILLGSKHSLTSQQATMITKALTSADLVDLDAPELLLALVDAIRSFAEVLASRGFISTTENPMPDAVRLDAKQRTLDSMLCYALMCMKQSNTPAVVSAVDAALNALSILVTGNADELFSVHFGRLLLRHHNSMPVCAFSDLVLRASNIQYYTAELVGVFLARLADVNLALRVTSELQYFTVLEGLLRGRKVHFTGSQLEELLRVVVLHHATFRPGLPAHLFRKIAIACLSAVLHPFHRTSLKDQFNDQSNALAEKCISSWLGAIDSDDADMRLVCIAAAPDVVQLPMSAGGAAEIWEHLLLRFDDANDLLRLEVAKALFVALRDHDLMSGELKSEIRQKLATSVKKLLIHMDDHEETSGVKAAVASCLRELCRAGKDIVVALVQQAKGKHHTPRFCDDVLTFAQDM